MLWGSVCRVNQRRSTSLSTGRYIAAIVIVLALIAGLVYWFAVRDDEEKTTTPGTKVATVQTFAMNGVPFTFEYPANFAKVQAPEGFLWIAGISPVDILDLRRVDSKEFSARSLPGLMGARLKAQPGLTVVGSGTEKIGGLDVATFTVDSGTTTQLRSKLVYFSAGGSTWQLECQSQESNRAAIEVACAQALATFTLS